MTYQRKEQLSKDVTLYLGDCREIMPGLGTVSLLFSLPTPPSVNQCYANVPGIGRVSTKKYRAWRRAALPYCLTVKRGIVTPPYRLTISVPADMRGDIANREKPLSDLLVKARVLPDDRHAERVTTERGSHRDGMAICRIEWGAE